jgi:formylglycine-generating enzyme required for sulfatase activity
MMGTMVRVPEGRFAMGCNAAADTECGGDEKPSPTITLSDFEIDATEVTQSSYRACVAASVCQVPACDFDPATRGAYPAVCVTWDEAALFCAWAGKRLPTEAEWEKAARGTDGRIYPWGNQAPDCARANFFGCGGSSAPAGGPAGGASPYDALQMAGNVWEWVNDYYEFDYYKRSPAQDPQGPPQGHERVKRGGGAADPPALLRTSQRDGIHPSKQGKLLGFRCARSPP